MIIATAILTSKEIETCRAWGKAMGAPLGHDVLCDMALANIKQLTLLARVQKYLLKRHNMGKQVRAKLRIEILAEIKLILTGGKKDEVINSIVSNR